MTAAAKSLAHKQAGFDSSHKLRIFKQHVESIRSDAVGLRVADDPPVVLPDVFASESATIIRLLVPLDGVDLRQVYIFATPCSIVLEMLAKCVLKRPGPVEIETQRYCITRELRFRHAIAKRSTAARLFGGSLEITSIKTANTGDEAWSEFIQVDTRGSLGACEAPAHTSLTSQASGTPVPEFLPEGPE